MVGIKKIGVKYCGGCNPTYERVEMIKRVQSQFGNGFLFLHYDREDIEILLLINGCLRACACENLNPPEFPSRSVVGEEDYESLIHWLNAFEEKGDF